MAQPSGGFSWVTSSSYRNGAQAPSLTWRVLLPTTTARGDTGSTEAGSNRATSALIRSQTDPCLPTAPDADTEEALPAQRGTGTSGRAAAPWWARGRTGSPADRGTGVTAGAQGPDSDGKGALPPGKGTGARGTEAAPSLSTCGARGCRFSVLTSVCLVFSERQAERVLRKG